MQGMEYISHGCGFLLDEEWRSGGYRALSHRVVSANAYGCLHTTIGMLLQLRMTALSGVLDQTQVACLRRLTWRRL
ncbi:hypothetical protein WJX75_000457 [Coccomyxa subellipsoidea]|uniref:Uncharacterized protein n=1 Tax=Coccomyxa subellipsoidea TaxID=248742 RepID=A0ABR2YIS8_9CHLO